MKRRAASQLRRVVLALTAFLCLTLGAGTVASAESFVEEDSLDGLNISYFKEMTDFEELLAKDEQAKMIYDTFSTEVDEDGTRIYKDEFLIGLIANIYHEGDVGAVEKAFSKYHQYDFCLPSGGIAIATMEDIEYLLSWTTDNKGTKKNLALKGSLGVSSLQWSYKRRIAYLSILKEIVEDKMYVSKSDMLKADAEMLLSELEQGSEFYQLVTYYAERNGGDVAAYAEAICDFYVVPGGACLSMKSVKGTLEEDEGASCKERVEEAKRLWKVFSSGKVKVVEIKVSSVVNKQ